MPTESSPNLNNDERLSLQLRLLNEAAAGHLDDLECPKCREAAVSVWFMHPAADVYRTWCGDAAVAEYQLSNGEGCTSATKKKGTEEMPLNVIWRVPSYFAGFSTWLFSCAVWQAAFCVPRHE
jgi:hypothetical protein